MSEALEQAKAHVESIKRLVMALSVDYDRLEELKTQRNENAWLAGWNMPGYMPDNGPCTFETAEEARKYIAEEMERVAEELEEQAGAINDEDGDSLDAADLYVSAQELRDTAEAIALDARHSNATEFGQTVGKWHYWVTMNPTPLDDNDAQELAELEEDAGDCASEEQARERINEDALSVEVRSGWGSTDSWQAEEFRIVLCTGGPHVELRGTLDNNGEPCGVGVFYSDGWAEGGELLLSSDDRETVLTYCEQFYFGE